MYVLGLKKKLIFVAIVEDKGYDVVFSKGKEFFKHVVIGKVKWIGVRVENIYSLEVDFSMYVAIPLGVRWGNVES